MHEARDPLGSCHSFNLNHIDFALNKNNDHAWGLLAIENSQLETSDGRDRALLIF